MPTQHGQVSGQPNLAEARGDSRAQLADRRIRLLDCVAQDLAHFFLHATAVSFRTSFGSSLHVFFQIVHDKLGQGGTDRRRAETWAAQKGSTGSGGASGISSGKASSASGGSAASNSLSFTARRRTVSLPRRLCLGSSMTRSIRPRLYATTRPSRGAGRQCGSLQPIRGCPYLVTLSSNVGFAETYLSWGRSTAVGDSSCSTTSASASGCF